MIQLQSPFVRRANSETALDFNGRSVHVLTSGQDNNNHLSLVEYFSSPGHEPPPHVHTREDEYFYILRGSIEVHCAGQVLQANAGDLIFLPQNVPHGWLIQTPELHCLILCTPSGAEGAFIEIGRPESEHAANYYETYFTEANHRRPENPTLEEQVKVASHHGVRILAEEEIAKDLPQYKPPTRLVEED